MFGDRKNVPALVTSNSPAVLVIPTTLDSLLEYLRKYGKPRLVCDNDGWYATIEMHVPNAGASFTIRSEFSNKERQYTALQSVEQLHERILETLALYK